MSTEVLREAASLIRERAEAASPGPWLVGQYDTIRTPDVDGELVHGEDCGCGGGIGYGPDVQHVASWHPVVAIAVADWLDAQAEVDERTQALVTFPNASKTFHNWVDLGSPAYAVAHAYLGREVSTTT